LKDADWDEVKDEYMERCIAKWREYAPNLTEDNILKATTQTPLDIEERFINMKEGGVFMGGRCMHAPGGWDYRGPWADCRRGHHGRPEAPQMVGSIERVFGSILTVRKRAVIATPLQSGGSNLIF
jgi:hypothetical protein